MREYGNFNHHKTIIKNIVGSFYDRGGIFCGHFIAGGEILCVHTMTKMRYFVFTS